MAGGLATRMRPLTDSIPKSMLPILDEKPFLEYQLELLKSHGIKDIILCVGYLGKMIEEYFGNGKQFRMNILYSYEKKQLLGTGGALKNAEHLLNDCFFLLWGDSYVRLRYQDMWFKHQASKKSVTISLFKNNNRFDKSNVLVKENKVVLYDKNSNNKEMQHIDAGISVVEKNILKDIPDNAVFAIENLFKDISLNNKMSGFAISERFFEVGSTKGLADMKEYAKTLENATLVEAIK